VRVSRYSSECFDLPRYFQRLTNVVRRRTQTRVAFEIFTICAMSWGWLSVSRWIRPGLYTEIALAGWPTSRGREVASSAHPPPNNDPSLVRTRPRHPSKRAAERAPHTRDAHGER